MKKVIVLLLLLISFNTYAESKEVRVGNVEKQSNVNNINIMWDDMQFTYVKETNYIWNDQTHKYEILKPKTYWISKNNEIMINNNSSKKAIIIPSYSLDILSGSFSKDRLIIDSYNSDDILFNIKGNLPSAYYKKTNIGKITLSIEMEN